jgi:tRNA modification GTPase
MMIYNSTAPETICALATPNVTSAIGIIRVSGVHAKKITQLFFSKSLENIGSHTLHFGRFHNRKNELIDEVLISFFENGKSFTGEESVEISCHGSVFIQQEILNTLLQGGCRLAQPGEFTQRAFLNGKLDLSQAEAVADLIAAQSKNAHQIALNQLRGNFSEKLSTLRAQLIHFASLIELELDFAEEDVEFADRTVLQQKLSEVIQITERLAHSFELGNAIKNGVPVAIVGEPNAGKSTLLNQFLNEDRAIVSNIAGTTRDVIEETINIAGILFRFIDTAGIRETTETIEALGIERSLQKIEQAKIVLVITDGQDSEQVQKAKDWLGNLKMIYPEKTILLIKNKMEDSQHDAGCISAKYGHGVEELKNSLVELIRGDFDFEQDIIVSNVRHFEALKRTIEALQAAYNGMNTGVAADFLAMDIRAAMRFLGNITGEIEIDRDILGNIFQHFCIGK